MAGALEDVHQEFERRCPIATQLAVLLTHQVPDRDRQVLTLLSGFLALRTPNEAPVDPVFVLMYAFARVRPATKAHPLALALALVNSPDTWNLLSPQAILDWAQFCARSSWVQVKEFVPEPSHPDEFRRLVRDVVFQRGDAPMYADVVVACLSSLAKNLGPKVDDIAAAEAAFLSANGLVEASARLRAFRRRKKGIPKPPGRPRTVPTTTDTTILKRWNPKRYASFAELARELHTEANPVTEDRVRKVVERERVAKLRRRRRRTNPPSSP